jgi:hypothetical protein
MKITYYIIIFLIEFKNNYFKNKDLKKITKMKQILYKIIIIKMIIIFSLIILIKQFTIIIMKMMTSHLIYHIKEKLAIIKQKE